MVPSLFSLPKLLAIEGWQQEAASQSSGMYTEAASHSQLDTAHCNWHIAFDGANTM